MSPEQARGERELDQRSDLFSIGVILYQLLTGERPFAADNLNQLLYQITSGQLTAPRELNPDITESLERVVKKALAHEVEFRFQSAPEFRAALVGDMQLSTREMPPARVSSEHLQVPGVFGPPLAGASDTQVDPAGRSTPLAWTGEGSPKRSSTGRALVWAAVAGLLVVAAVVTVLLLRKEPGARHASTPPAAATRPPPKAATMATPLVMRIQVETIRLNLRVEPADSRVFLDGKVVKTTPIVLPRSVARHRVRVEADGFVTQDLKVSAISDQTLVIQLKPHPRVAPRRRRRRRRVVRPIMRPPPQGMKQIRAITDI